MLTAAVVMVTIATLPAAATLVAILAVVMTLIVVVVVLFAPACCGNCAWICCVGLGAVVRPTTSPSGINVNRAAAHQDSVCLSFVIAFVWFGGPQELRCSMLLFGRTC
jgi:hypothetical protein